MEWKSSNLFRVARLITVLLLTGVLLTTSSGAVMAQSSAAASSSPGARLVGTWAVRVTIRDCTTNAPLGPSLNSLVTFHRGGTLSESPGSGAFAIGQRSSGHGTWTREHGHTFSQRFVALILFDTAPNLPGTPGFNPAAPVSPGFFAGWQTVSHTVRLTDDDHLASSGTNAFYKANGELYRTGCSTAVAARFE